MPSPGSLVRFKSGEYGLVVAVTPKGEGDKIVPLGFGYPTDWAIYEISEIVHEAESNTETSDK